ncbi:putative MmgE/Prp family protein [Gonapodya prolifera JEL478]|uniref:Putative MmgE/Prp family protein n=1 Tax=Gonapodya prolifera (strain JEL478) TaxID=1344416 RepID=A0A139A5Y8_GONPJ|nr:putative MmgE/Prp family protein [Gonapodya prolifera JEL478]|eukprot:KXS11793.1 putative MmgE/Prp family protein [Gonapodya prolifera JEL478]
MSVSAATRQKSGITLSLARLAVSYVNPSASASTVNASASTFPASLHPDVVTLTKQCMLDTLAVTIAANGDPLVDILQDDLVEQGGSATASVWGSKLRLPALSAALLNGTKSHALDYDDVNFAILGHPSVACLPPMYALAETRPHVVTWDKFVRGFVASYEIMCRLGMLLEPDHYDGRGFHATGTLGALGAAAGSAAALGLGEVETAHAIGNAAAQAGGLKGLFGTHCKPLHAGRAAYNGLSAARLAERGFQSRVDAIECDQGFASAHSSDFHPDRCLATPNNDLGLHLRDNLFKYHASCYLTHAPIESALKCRSQLGYTPLVGPSAKPIGVDEIAKIKLVIDETTSRVCNIPKPTTGLEAKFSLRLTVAAALRGVDTSRLDVWTSSLCEDPALIALRDKVEIDFRKGWDPAGSKAEVEVELTDGRVAQAAHDSSKAAENLEEQWARLEAKATGLVQPVLGEDKAAKLVEMVKGLGTKYEVADLKTVWE